MCAVAHPPSPAASPTRALGTTGTSCHGSAAGGIGDEVLFLPLAVPLADPLRSLGGKASALDELLRAELPVPASAVVTTAAFRRACASAEVRELIGAFQRGGPRGRFDAEAVDAAFRSAGMPDDLRASILAARRHVAPTGPVAIRSSATAEDLTGASFAGQFRSVIGVDSDDDVIDAVLMVWASLWHPAPHAYRRLQGMDDAEVAMAVIVQRMIPATTAGVVFTVDPGGAPDHLRLEHVEGLGEALVSGDVTPTAEVLPRRLGQGVDPVVAEAARLALRAEAVAGTPQDVEWATDEVRTWLVQSRPITTSDGAAAHDLTDGFETAIAPERRYTTAGIGEMLPGVFPALRWATAGFMVEEAVRHVVGELGALPPNLVDVDGFVVRVRGRAALDLDHMSDVASVLPGGSAEELEEQYFGTDVGASTPERVGVVQRIRHDLRVVSSTRSARREQAVVGAAVIELADTAFDPTACSELELLARRNRLVDLGVRATVAELAVAAAAVAAFRRLETALQRQLGDRAGTQWAARVTSGMQPPPVIRAAVELHARIAESHPAALRCETWTDADVELSGSPAPHVVAEVTEAARRAGCQRVVGGTAWSEDPERFWHLVRDAPRRSNGTDDGMAALDSALDEVPGRIRRRVLTGQFVDVRRQFIRRLVRDARDLVRRREDAKADVLALGGQIRVIDLELGSRLAARGELIHPLDVEHLHPAELRRAIIGDGSPVLAEILHRRRCVERWRSDDELPARFTGRPPRARPQAPAGNRFSGWGASPGRHTGPVRFLTAPDERSVRPGDVVLARRTDASWTPVFVRAAAIIVEEGGPLSHAAILARELGLPAVLNLPGITARLRDARAVVTVDGDEGRVIVHSATGPSGEGVAAPC